MTPLYRRAESALTQLAFCDARFAQGITDAATFTRSRAAREELEAILREAGVIPATAVREHWLDHDTAAQDVISLDAARAARAVRR